jgi:hypothetical protein
MATIKEVAQAFVEGRRATCHNAYTNGTVYSLHGHFIARKENGDVYFDWCGWHSQTTANHMNNILAAMHAGTRVSASEHARAGINGFRRNLE